MTSKKYGMWCKEKWKKKTKIENGIIFEFGGYNKVGLLNNRINAQKQTSRLI